MSGKLGDNFENGIFWELYLDLERQFSSFLQYVPFLPGNEAAYSYKLLNLILSIGGHVDSAFKEMARFSEFSQNIECKKTLELLGKSEERKKDGKAPLTVPISCPMKAFEREYELSKRKVIFKCLAERDIVAPFAPHNEITKAPKWWEIYNGLKHDVAFNLRDATLQNTRDALAGAFLLNVLHKPAKIRFLNLGALRVVVRRRADSVYKMTPEDFQNVVEKYAKDDPTILAYIETSLFVYDYVQRE